MNGADVISQACGLVGGGDAAASEALVRAEYPFKPIHAIARQNTAFDLSLTFLRDGAIDRYTGQRLVFTPVLRVLWLRLGPAFPYHTNWKLDSTHMAYWDLAPTLDHVVPVARGGQDESSNWVCCTQLTNSRKAHWTLEELGWPLLPPGDLTQWDGLVGWFLTIYQADPTGLGKIPYFRGWQLVARRALEIFAKESGSP